MARRFWSVAAATMMLGFGVSACGEGDGGGLSGTIRIDGSSTVAPLSEAAAELFQQEQRRIRVTVGTSGTGGGFEKFCAGETDISNASRPIEEGEAEDCEANGISYEELHIGNDGLAIALNTDNDWVECLTVDELNMIWDSDSDVDNWNEVRDEFPDEDLELYGPGTDSGTFDYFTEAINGEAGRQRTDYNNIGEDDQAGLRGVQGEVGAMFYVGLSYVEQNSDELKTLEIENEDGECVAPSKETVQSGEYNPLGRPLFIYPSAQALERPEVQAFLEFYVENQAAIAELALFVPLNPEQEAKARETLDKLIGAAGGPYDGSTGAE